VHALSGADLQDVVNELRVRQNEDGAYRLWPGGSEVAGFPSLYAQHFLLEAASRGQRVPADLIHRGDAYLRMVASRDGDNLDEERDSAYALYLLTRQGTLVSAEAAALRKRLMERYKGQWEQDLAAAWLAGALKLMHQDRDADALIQAIRFGASTPASLYEAPMTRDAWLLYLLARHFPDRLPNLPSDLLDRLATRISANTYDSLSAATTVMALDAYAGTTGPASESHLTVAEVLQDRTLRTLQLPAGLMPKVPFSDSAKAIQFSSGTDLNAYYLMTQAGFDRTPPKEALTKGFEILHELTDAGGSPLARIKMGEEAEVHLKVRAIATSALTQVALVDLLPGGFELVIPPQPAADTYQQASPEESGEGEESRSESTGRQGGTRPGECGFCKGTSPEGLSYADPREDRVVFYMRLTKDIQELVYRIKATNVGSYSLPPAFGEAMYDRSQLAHSVAGHIEVVRP
jgi:uncharacterized protein YfaS (alpha-2-macroglobulin family)